MIICWVFTVSRSSWTTLESSDCEASWPTSCYWVVLELRFNPTALALLGCWERFTSAVIFFDFFRFFRLRTWVKTPSLSSSSTAALTLAISPVDNTRFMLIYDQSYSSVAIACPLSRRPNSDVNGQSPPATPTDLLIFVAQVTKIQLLQSWCLNNKLSNPLQMCSEKSIMSLTSSAKLKPAKINKIRRMSHRHVHSKQQP